MSDFPFEINEIDGEFAEKYPEVKADIVLVGPKKYAFRKITKPFLPLFYNFKARSDDIWIYGHPRSGTTMAQEITWLIANDLNFEKAALDVLDVRYPLLESVAYFSEELSNINKNQLSDEVKNTAEKWEIPAWEKLENAEGKRFIKTHSPFSLGPKNLLNCGCKVLYLARNPKDVIVSTYHFYVDFQLYHSTFEKFWELFRNGLLYGTPWFEHLKEAWALRDHPNVLFLFYEDLKKDLRKTIIRIGEFLEKPLSEVQIAQLEDHLKIENFRKNKSVNNEHLRELGIMKCKENNFIRKGVTGGWRNYFTGNMRKEVDQWIEENLKGTDIQLPDV